MRAKPVGSLSYSFPSPCPEDLDSLLWVLSDSERQRSAIYNEVPLGNVGGIELSEWTGSALTPA